MDEDAEGNELEPKPKKKRERMDRFRPFYGASPEARALRALRRVAELEEELRLAKSTEIT